MSRYNEFFSDLEIYGIQTGYKIVAEIVDRGYDGLLKMNSGENKQDDFVHFTGFVRETSAFLQDADDKIYNYIV